MNRYRFFILKALSYSPFFRVTDDSRFNEVTQNPKELRYSLFSFNVGIKSFYFVTRDYTKKFKWVHTLDLFEAQKYRKNIEDYGIEYDSYKAELEGKEAESIVAEKEFINLRMSEIANIKNKTFNKFLAYLAIFAFIFPIYSPKLTNILPYIKSYKLAFIVVLIYIFLNLISLAISFVKVRGVTRTLFDNIKSAEKPLQELNALFFYEWKIFNNESNFEVAIIKNIEKYMFGTVLFSLLFMLSINIEEWSDKQGQSNLNSIAESNSEVIIFQDQLGFQELLKENQTQIDKIKEGILENKYNTVIVISNDNDISEELIELFKLYTKDDAGIISIKEGSYNNRIEVILLKEEQR